MILRSARDRVSNERMRRRTSHSDIRVQRPCLFILELREDFLSQRRYGGHQGGLDAIQHFPEQRLQFRDQSNLSTIPHFNTPTTHPKEAAADIQFVQATIGHPGALPVERQPTVSSTHHWGSRDQLVAFEARRHDSVETTHGMKQERKVRHCSYSR